MAALNWYIFSKKSGRPSSTGYESFTFGSNCSANFEPILDCFIPNFKSEYDNLENINTDRVNTVVFNLHKIKQLKFFWGHPVVIIALIIQKFGTGIKLDVFSTIVAQKLVLLRSYHVITCI